jgi:hypothetical protein
MVEMVPVGSGAPGWPGGWPEPFDRVDGYGLIVVTSTEPQRRGPGWPADNLTATFGGVAQLVERLTGSQEVRGFESLRLHPDRTCR